MSLTEISVLPTGTMGTWSGDIKANIALCTETDGNRLTVRMDCDCFAKTIGSSRYDKCKVSGRWRLTRDGIEVVTGGSDVGPYPGSGSYELSADVSVNASTIHSEGTISSGAVAGTVSVPAAFTSQAGEARLSASVGNRPRTARPSRSPIQARTKQVL